MLITLIILTNLLIFYIKNKMTTTTTMMMMMIMKTTMMIVMTTTVMMMTTIQFIFSTTKAFHVVTENPGRREDNLLGKHRTWITHRTCVYASLILKYETVN